jgi:tetratricopeptide (TPR) repeat protein
VAHHPGDLAGHLVRLRSGGHLDVLAVPGDERTALRSAFDLSYDALQAEQQRLLSLVPGENFTPDAVAALADVTTARAARLLDGLESAHLLEQREAARYAFHDLLRRYAGDRCRAEDSEAALGRLFGWYLHTADAAAKVIHPQLLRLPGGPATGTPAASTDRAAALAWLATERVNLTAAGLLAAERGFRPVTRLLADTLRGYFWISLHRQEWSDLGTAALAAAEVDGDARAVAVARMNLGDLCLRVNRHDRAVEHYERAVDHLRRAGWLEAQGVVFDKLGFVQYESGAYAHAAAGHTKALALYRDLGIVSGQATALGNLGDALHALGQFAEALTRFAEALPSLRELEGRAGTEAATLRGVAAVDSDAGRHDRAADRARTALELARRVGDRRVEADVLIVLGAVQQCLARPAEAIHCHLAALELARRTGIHYSAVEALIGLATAREDTGDARQALDLARAAGYRGLEGRVLTVLARLLLAGGEAGQAAEHARRALEVHRETGHRLGEARALTVLADLTEGNDPARPWREEARSTSPPSASARIEACYGERGGEYRHRCRVGGGPGATFGHSGRCGLRRPRALVRRGVPQSKALHSARGRAAQAEECEWQNRRQAPALGLLTKYPGTPIPGAPAGPGTWAGLVGVAVTPAAAIIGGSAAEAPYAGIGSLPASVAAITTTNSGDRDCQDNRLHARSPIWRPSPRRYWSFTSSST